MYIFCYLQTKTKISFFSVTHEASIERGSFIIIRYFNQVLRNLLFHQIRVTKLVLSHNGIERSSRAFSRASRKNWLPFGYFATEPDVPYENAKIRGLSEVIQVKRLDFMQKGLFRQAMSGRCLDIYDATALYGLK